MVFIYEGKQELSMHSYPNISYYGVDYDPLLHTCFPTHAAPRSLNGDAVSISPPSITTVPSWNRLWHNQVYIIAP
jgi:hypothetical protein